MKKTQYAAVEIAVTDDRFTRLGVVVPVPSHLEEATLRAALMSADKAAAYGPFWARAYAQLTG